MANFFFHGTNNRVFVKAIRKTQKPRDIENTHTWIEELWQDDHLQFSWYKRRDLMSAIQPKDSYIQQKGDPCVRCTGHG